MTEKIARLVVERRRAVLAVMLLITLATSLLIPLVPVNTDMTKYLPESSSMKAGLDIVESELGSTGTQATMRVMATGVPEGERAALAERLAGLDGVASVTYKEGDPACNSGENALYVVEMDCGYRSPEHRALEADVETLAAEMFPEAGLTMADDDANSSDIPLQTLVIALGLLLAILFAMCASWLEPLLFLATIGCAVGINLGTNVVLGEVSSVTMCIAALLQLVLSMDYSIILMNRYRQELATCGAREGAQPAPEVREEAMRRAVAGAFSSVASSSLTTFVGLLALVFMSFKIGADLGLVLAKGVACSLVCVLTILPALILSFDGAIRRSAKPQLDLERPLGPLAAFSTRFRHAVAVCFVAVFALAYALQAGTGTSYTLNREDPISQVFPRTTTAVLVYENADEDTVAAHLGELEANPLVSDVLAWGNTLGKPYTSAELAEVLAEQGGEEAGGFDKKTLDVVYYLFHSGEDIDELKTAQLMRLYSGAPGTVDPDLTMTMAEFVTYLDGTLLQTERFGENANEAQREQVRAMAEQVEEAEAQMRGTEHSVCALTLATTAGSPEAFAFLDSLDAWCSENLSDEYHLVGDCAMAWETSAGFGGEHLFITLLTAGAIFLVVALAFRNLLIPFVLVLVVQCGVFLTVTVVGLQGYSIYYLALLIVQCILMGATIDYGILFANNYRDARRALGVRDALEQAYARSIHTVLTSGLIIVLVTGAVSVFGVDPTINQICRTISMGAACTIVLILVFLPSILATFDRLVCGREGSVAPDGGSPTLQ